MAKRNFTRQTASLRTFLQTGRLGPLSCGQPLVEVATLIGPPHWWATDAHDFSFPLDWGYAGLEISFSVEPPHGINRLKLDPALLGSTRFHDLCSLLRLSLDEVPILGRPSELLSSRIWERNALQVGLHLVANDPRLTISLSGIELLFVLYDSDVQKLAGVAREDIEEAVRLFDSMAVLHGIYAGTTEVERPWRRMQADTYLQCVAQPKS